MKNNRFFAIWAPSQASQSQNGEDVSSGIGGQEFSSRIQRIHRIHYFPPEMVSGAAVQTLPNHAQESQDDVSSQANSLKLFPTSPSLQHLTWGKEVCGRWATACKQLQQPTTTHTHNLCRGFRLER